MDTLFENIIEDVNFQEISDIMKNLVKDGRELNYQKGEIGITTLISCPRKYKLKQIHGYPQVDSLLIEDGFLFEKVFKAALKKKYGDKFKEELELPYECDGLKIRGHLDCFVEFPNTVVGIELKHTLTELAPNIKNEPPKIIVLDPDNPEIKLNPKYILQSRIERYLLEKLYPNKKVKHYLFVKTTLKGAWRYFKTYIILPIRKSISDEEFKELIRHFKECDYPLDPSECKYCPYKSMNLCKGYNTIIQSETDLTPTPELEELLQRRENLIAELETVEDAIKKILKDKKVVWNGKTIGRVTYTGFSYDVKELSKILYKKGYSPLNFLQIKPHKIKELEELLGAEIEKVRSPYERKKWSWGENKS